MISDMDQRHGGHREYIPLQTQKSNNPFSDNSRMVNHFPDLDEWLKKDSNKENYNQSIPKDVHSFYNCSVLNNFVDNQNSDDEEYSESEDLLWSIDQMAELVNLSAILCVIALS